PSCVITNGELTNGEAGSTSNPGADAVSVNGPPVPVAFSPTNAALPLENGVFVVDAGNSPVFPGSNALDAARATLPPLRATGNACPPASWGTTVTLWTVPPTGV